MIPELLKHVYGLVVAHSVTPEQPGVSSRVVIVELDDGRKLVIKESAWYDGFSVDPSAVLEQVYTLAATLKARGVLLQTAIPNKHGNFVTDQKGKHLVVLKYLEGKTFSGDLREFAAAGRAMGQWHKAGRGVGSTTPIPVEKPYEESRALYLHNFRGKLLSEHVCALPEVCQLVRDKIDLLDKQMIMIDSVFAANPPQTITLLHNDFNSENGLYHSDGSFATFLDVDQLSRGSAVWDLGNTLLSLLSSVFPADDENGHQKATYYFLRAYHQELPLASAEYQLIPAAAIRWDVMRILRSLRRHHLENNRLPALTQKIKDRLLDRLEKTPQLLDFLTAEWLQSVLNGDVSK